MLSFLKKAGQALLFPKRKAMYGGKQRTLRLACLEEGWKGSLSHLIVTDFSPHLHWGGRKDSSFTSQNSDRGTRIGEMEGVREPEKNLPAT